MCKKWTVAYGDFIGQRMVGWCVFNGKDFNFLSDKQVQARLKIGELVNGLKLVYDEAVNEQAVQRDDNFSGFLMGKSGLGFNPIMTEDDGADESVMNKYYALVKVVKSKANTEYHFITNRCGMEVFTEEQLKAMLAVMNMGGVKLDEAGKLLVHKGVDIEDTTVDQNKNQAAPKGKEVV